MTLRQEAPGTPHIYFIHSAPVLVRVVQHLRNCATQPPAVYAGLGRASEAAVDKLGFVPSACRKLCPALNVGCCCVTIAGRALSSDSIMSLWMLITPHCMRLCWAGNVALDSDANCNSQASKTVAEYQGSFESIHAFNRLESIRPATGAVGGVSSVRTGARTVKITGRKILHRMHMIAASSPAL